MTVEERRETRKKKKKKRKRCGRKRPITIFIDRFQRWSKFNNKYQ